MNELIEAIRAATAQDATDEARHAGATACRTILAALAATPGESLAAPDVAASDPATPASSVAMAMSALRGMPPDQLLDLAIARLRAALPAEAAPPPPRPMKFHIVNLPRVLPPGRKT